ncbi:MAG: hypothetical protein WC557_07655, partial [Ignavibacteriaceae bacterium]
HFCNQRYHKWYCWSKKSSRSIGMMEKLYPDSSGFVCTAQSIYGCAVMTKDDCLSKFAIA